MDEVRKGQIALILLRYEKRKNGIRLFKGSRRELGNIAKATGIPIKELSEFAKEETMLLIEEIFKE